MGIRDTLSKSLLRHYASIPRHLMVDLQTICILISTLGEVGRSGTHAVHMTLRRVPIRTFLLRRFVCRIHNAGPVHTDRVL